MPDKQPTSRTDGQTASQPARQTPSQTTSQQYGQTARQPTNQELAILTARLNTLREHYKANPEAAKKLIATGESNPNEKLDPSELAAWTGITTIILNLDETITKE